MEGYKRFISVFAKGSVIYKKDDLQENFYIINKGKVQIKLDDKVIVTTLSKGDFFGEESLLENQNAYYTVEAIEDSEVLKIPFHSLVEMMKQSTDISLKILKKLSEKDLKIIENLRKLKKDTAKPEELPEKIAENNKEKTSSHLSPDVVAYLIIKRSNRIVQLKKQHTIIGRRDYTTGFIPDIDLTEEDEEKYISRKHAKISYIDGKFYISEEPGAINGTFLNNQKLKSGVKYELHNEDEITLCHLAILFKH